MEESLDKEVSKRWRAWWRMTRIHTLLGIVSSFIGIGVLFYLLALVAGYDYAIDNTLPSLLEMILVSSFAVLGWSIYQMFFKIPAEIYKEQKQAIDKRLPEELVLEIEEAPVSVTKSIGVIALNVVSKEKKKIVELRALVNFHHLRLQDKLIIPKGWEIPIESSYSLNYPLIWLANDGRKTKADLHPDDRIILLVCELQVLRMDSEDVTLALMATEPKITKKEFSKECIVSAEILIQGRFDDDYEFKRLKRIVNFYAKPSEKRIMFLDKAEKMWDDIPPAFIERSKDIIKHLEAKRNEKKT